MVDEGFDLQIDPANCGACGKACSFGHAAPLCQAGQCALGACFDGYADADKQPANGCECLFTNNKVEICDGQDNDCDGMIDEDFDFQTNTTHCGGCFKPCGFAQASASCVNGACTLGACMPGLHQHQQRPARRLRIPLHHQRHRAPRCATARTTTATA